MLRKNVQQHFLKKHKQVKLRRTTYSIGMYISIGTKVKCVIPAFDDIYYRYKSTILSVGTNTG